MRISEINKPIPKPKTSEYAHQEELNHFLYKHKRWRQTPKEKEAVASAIQRFPNRNHTPVGFNNK